MAHKRQRTHTEVSEMTHTKNGNYRVTIREIRDDSGSCAAILGTLESDTRENLNAQIDGFLSAHKAIQAGMTVDELLAKLTA